MVCVYVCVLTVMATFGPKSSNLNNIPQYWKLEKYPSFLLKIQLGHIKIFQSLLLNRWCPKIADNSLVKLDNLMMYTASTFPF